MKTVFVVIEKRWQGKHISKIFQSYHDALSYLISIRGPEEFYDFDSAYQYSIEEWEVQ